MDTPTDRSLFERFLHSQSSGSLVLLLATITAVIWANSPWAATYHTLCHLDIGTHFAGKQYHLSLDHWVKDGLMAIFFFVVGLEIKREIITGELSSVRKAALPVMAAIGGGIVPALIYFFLNPADPAAKGWAVPMATDIAFALGILALFGKRVPLGLKVFLTALAIVDDLLAILVIAIFYTEQIRLSALLVAVILLVLLAFLIRSDLRRPAVNLALLVSIWVCIFLSGIHATIAGVLVALTIPVRASIEPQKFFDIICRHMAQLKESELSRESMISDKKQRQAIERIYLTAGEMLPAGITLEENLHNIQAFIILPLFALFAAGVTLHQEYIAALPGPVSMGIFLGLVLGKPAGICLFSYLVIKSGQADMPAGVTWGQLCGVSCLGGIGFTMSIFITELAFTDNSMIATAKIAIFIASIFAAGTGYAFLNKALPPQRPDQAERP